MHGSPLPVIPSVSAHQFQASDLAQMIVSPVTNRIIDLNDRCCDLIGFSREVLQEKSFTSLYPQHFGELHCFTEQVLYYGFGYNRVLPLPLAEAEDMRIEHYAVRCPSPEGDLIYLTLFDLEEFHKRHVDMEANSYQRKGYEEWQRIERFFREIELQNQMILKAAGEGIYGVNSEGITIFVNHAAEEMLGWYDSELVGQDMHSLVHYAHPDGSHYANEECPIYAAFRLGKVTHVENEVFWHKDGKPIQVEYTSTPIVDNGEYVGAVIVFRDVSQRRQREQELRQALEEIDRLRNRLEQENAYLQEEIRIKTNRSGIIGTSPAVEHIHRQVQLAAPTDAGILLTGESGTGKELVAHALHEASRRRKHALIRVNCAAIPRELFESEFFGHVKGAFTGALKDRVGRFELADGGTLFLDEVGEIPLELQSKLLRVLQDRKFERVGEDRTRSADVRLIAATNRDLKKEVAEGRFREDLYFRLNVFPIHCAPLRDRRGDIPALAEHFLQQAATRLNLPKPTLTVGNINALTTYDWPGNIRELQNVIERAAILASGGKIILHLPETGRTDATKREAGGQADVDRGENTAEDILTMEELVALEKQNIERALRQCHGRVSGDFGAARLLQIKPTTLYSKIKKFGIAV